MRRGILASVLVILASVYIYAVPPGTKDEISARLEPFGSVCRAGDDCGATDASVSSGQMSGQQVYDQFCFVCHTTGVGGAPKVGEAADWTDRTGKGMDELMASTLNGLNAMPAKGTCMNCSDEELSEAVAYMLDSVQ